jgi:hypothetical protein
MSFHLAQGMKLEGVKKITSLWDNHKLNHLTLTLNSTLVVEQRLHVLDNIPANILSEMNT